MMDTRQLLQCMQQDYWIAKTSFGVYPRDQLPDCGHPGLYIINVDSSQLPGSHWLLIHIDSWCNGRVYDSLGSQQPYVKKIEASIHGHCVWMVQERLQCLNSDVCGAYALYFARELSKAPDNIMGPFNTSNCGYNDVYICNYASKHFAIL